MYTSAVKPPTGIAADPALTAHGVDQARDMAAFLTTLNPPIEAVYSSPYYRCLQTITPFVDLVNGGSSAADFLAGGALMGARLTLIRPESGLSDWYGSAQFDQPRPAAPDVLKRMFPAYDEDYQSAVVPTIRGEDLDELHDRVAVALRAIIEQCDREGRKAVVLCTHAAVIIALGRVLTGAMPVNIAEEDFRAFTCGLSVFRRQARSDTAPKGQAIKEEDDQQYRASPDTAHGASAAVDWRDGRGVGGRWTCLANSDCSFLPGGEERGW